ncbi:MAG: ABC transporter ATP-binding protein, partial [Clostridia bacterium]|nr:ABC transporter ATP-binding protein [Clostridia bacterium]
KTYSDFSISIDFEVAEGETLALVGPSGSGKTTAINLIAGLIRPDSGKIIIDGEDISTLPPWKRNISLVFQDLALFPHLDVGGNIAYGLFIRNVPKSERLKIIEETLKIVRLPGYASRRIHTLSGGERQRVAIARALASNPDLLLLDEPFSSLDAPLRNSMRREFLELRIKSKAACIFITHDREEAMMLGDRIALMTGGRIAETGPGRELFLEPKTETAARFFGAGQVLPCQVLESHEKETIVSSALGVLAVPHSAEYNPASPKLFVPHDAIMYDKPSSETRWKPFSAQCIGSFFEGQRLVLKLLLHDNEPIPMEIIASPRTKPPATGSAIDLWADQSLLRFVNAEQPNSNP